MNKIAPKYRSYLLRLWWADNAGQPVWRISIEEPGRQTQTHFDSLAALCTYLDQQLSSTEKKEGPAEELR